MLCKLCLDMHKGHPVTLIAATDAELRELALDVKHELEYWADKISSQLNDNIQGRPSNLQHLLSNVFRVKQFVPYNKLNHKSKTLIDFFQKHPEEAN